MKLPPPPDLTERAEVTAFLAGMELVLEAVRRLVGLSAEERDSLRQASKELAKELWPDWEPSTLERNTKVLPIPTKALDP